MTSGKAEKNIMYEIVRSDEEIDDLLDQCIKASERGTRFPGETYENGIRNAIEWLTDNSSVFPME